MLCPLRVWSGGGIKGGRAPSFSILPTFNLAAFVMFGDQSSLPISNINNDLNEPVPGMQHDLIAGLNPPQQDAVVHGDGPILVLAGAGSGKTRVLTHRIAQLIEARGVRSDRIFAVTFTNKAAEQMRTRLKELLSERADGIWISTFHSAGLRILRHKAQLLSYSNQFVVYDDQDSKGVLKQVLKELNINEDRYPSTPSHARSIGQKQLYLARGGWKTGL